MEGACASEREVRKVWGVQGRKGGREGEGREAAEALPPSLLQGESGKDAARLRRPCPQPIRQGDMGAG